MVVGVDDSAVEWIPLPDAELVFGLSGDACHAVTHTTAVAAIGQGLIFDAAAVALCGELCGLASAWGAYERGSRYLSRSDVCQRCVWIVAGAAASWPIKSCMRARMSDTQQPYRRR